MGSLVKSGKSALTPLPFRATRLAAVASAPDALPTRTTSRLHWPRASVCPQPQASLACALPSLCLPIRQSVGHVTVPGRPNHVRDLLATNHASLLQTMALPDGFIPLRDVLNCNEKTCFIGAITNIQAPIPVDKAGQDHEIHFVIRDKFPGDEKDSVACILKHKKACLPTGDPGDIAILRGMKLEILGDKNTKTLVMASEFHSQALFFPSKTIPASGGASKVPFKGMAGSQPPDDDEQMAVVKMKATAASLLEDLKDPKVMFLARLGSKAANAKRGKRQSLIGNMTFNLFYDLVGEVVKTFWDGDCVDLYVTDYTINKDLFLYEDKSQLDRCSGDKRPWPGPFGQMTMQIRCYEPHAGAARELKEGDFVFMQNVRTKWSQKNKLEGAIHQDLQYPNKIGVRKCTHKLQLGDLIERKAEYEKKRIATLLADGDTNAPKKPSAIASSKKKLTKAQKRRLQKEQELKELEKKSTEKEKPIKGINNNGTFLCSTRPT